MTIDPTHLTHLLETAFAVGAIAWVAHKVLALQGAVC
jgi:hypothetical protein